MKFATAFLARFSRAKSEQPDVFELRLMSMTAPAQQGRRARARTHHAPSLFHFSRNAEA